MFGNLKGWLISLVMFGVTGYLIYFAGRSPQHTTVATVKTFAATLKPAKLDFDYSTLFPPGTEDKDAGELVQALAEEAHIADLRSQFQKLNKAMDEGDPKKRDKARRDAVKPLEPMLDHLVEATKCNRMTLCPPDKIVVYQNKPYLRHLTALGRKAAVAGRAYCTSGVDA